YQYLTSEQPGDDGNTDIPWNFTKFLVDRNGAAVKRFGPQVTPEEISEALSEVL
ncbi:MAG: glutathione peroxidase, partial [Deltaproteobacteria bacterium]|nr:glutathione peroxidase [Deltaproteobacteria bacterium]